jgi:RNA polymerase sigma-70 factor (ECF subfamily)
MIARGRIVIQNTMASLDSVQITQLLNDLRDGDASAKSKLMPLVYPELRKIAAKYMRRERSDHTLQATALVHDAYLRIVGNQSQWHNRVHFFAVAAEVMRQILVDHARRRRAIRRGGGGARVELVESLLVCTDSADMVLEIDGAIEKLAQLDPRQANIVVLRFFGGLTDEEIAEVEGISARTVRRDWNMARAWFHGILRPKRSDDA